MIKSFADWLLKTLCHPDYYTDIRGDLEEIHQTNQSVKSDWHYLKEVILLLRWNLLKSWPIFQFFGIPLRLLPNYFVVARRNMWRYKGYSALNIAGLAMGIAIFIVSYLFVYDELSYDQWHHNGDRIYRITHAEAVNDIVRYRNGTAYPAAALMKATFPQIEEVARLMGHSDYLGLPLITHGENSFLLEELSWADPAIVDILSLKFVEGNPKTCLNELRNLVITQSLAKRLFNDQSAVGKQVQFNLDRDNDPDGMMEPYTMTISAVIEDLPTNSHLQFELLGNIRFSNWENWSVDNWYSNSYPTYLKLKQGVDPDVLAEAFEGFVSQYYDKDIKDRLTLYLQPIEDIRLSALPGDPEPNSHQETIAIISIIAALVLLLASINYMNLSTARFTNRIKEVGLRKVIGARRGQLVLQFLLESSVTTTLAMVVSLALVYLFLPFFNLLMDKSLTLGVLDPSHFPILMGFVLLLGLVSGAYPALFLASFKPAAAFKGGTQGKGSSWVRKSLVVFQFVITITLLIAIGTIYHQLRYIQQLDLDIKKEEYVFLRSKEEVFSRLETFERFKSQLVALPAIASASGSWSLPFGVNAPVFFYPFLPEGFSNNDRFHMHLFRADHEFLETFNLELVAGRDFSREFVNDPTQAFILNEQAIKALGWTNESAIGKDLEVFSGGGNAFKQGKVIGVVRDFNFLSLHEKVRPLAISMVNDQSYRYIAIRIDEHNLSQTVQYIEQTWSEFVPGWPPELFFMEDEWHKNYEKEEQLAGSVKYLTVVGLLIACLGLFGLASYTAEQKEKEIGIRKVLGSSVPAIIRLLTSQFTGLVLVAFVVAGPVGYYYSEQWLTQFAYRVDQTWWLYALVVLTVLMTTLMTVAYQSVKAAMANPVEVLRAE